MNGIVAYSLCQDWILPIAAKLKALAHSLSEVDARAWLCVEGVISIFSNQYRISGLLETLITLEELYEAILCLFGSVPGYFSRLEEYCYTDLLWSSRNVLRTRKLHLILYQHGGEGIITELWLNFGWSVPLRIASCYLLGPTHTDCDCNDSLSL